MHSWVTEYIPLFVATFPNYILFFRLGSIFSKDVGHCLKPINNLLSHMGRLCWSVFIFFLSVIGHLWPISTFPLLFCLILTQWVEWQVAYLLVENNSCFKKLNFWILFLVWHLMVRVNRKDSIIKYYFRILDDSYRCWPAV